MNVAAHAVGYTIASTKRGQYAPLFVVLSVVVHVVGFILLQMYVDATPPAPKQKPLELVMIEVKPPPPPPPEVKEEPPPPPVKPPPVKVAKVTPPKEIPKEQPPPPPNEEPPPETPPKQVPIITGISMQSTSTTGTFSAPVGNTLYGKNDDKAAKPEEVKPYAAPKYMPAYQVDAQPVVLNEVRGKYTAEATRAGVEGSVILKITIDTDGNVTEAKLIQGLGYGLDEVALESIKKFKWRPATKGGESVSTTITYKYTFWLE